MMVMLTVTNVGRMSYVHNCMADFLSPWSKSWRLGDSQRIFLQTASKSRGYTHFFTHRGICTENSLHWRVFRHRRVYTQKLLHTEAFTHIGLYSPKLFTVMSLHRGVFSTEKFLHIEDLHKTVFTTG